MVNLIFNKIIFIFVYWGAIIEIHEKVFVTSSIKFVLDLCSVNVNVTNTLSLIFMLCSLIAVYQLNVVSDLRRINLSKS